MAPAASADVEGIAVGEEDEQQRVSSQCGDHGPEEGEEQFSPCSTLLCDQIDNNCCTSEVYSSSKPNVRLRGNGGISR